MDAPSRWSNFPVSNQSAKKIVINFPYRLKLAYCFVYASPKRFSQSGQHRLADLLYFLSTLKSSDLAKKRCLNGCSMHDLVPSVRFAILL